jgi:hypothetical protein
VTEVLSGVERVQSAIVVVDRVHRGERDAVRHDHIAVLTEETEDTVRPGSARITASVITVLSVARAERSIVHVVEAEAALAVPIASESMGTSVVTATVRVRNEERSEGVHAGVTVAKETTTRKKLITVHTPRVLRKNLRRK